LAQLIDRIIIGPTEFPEAIKEAFTDILANSGVSSPEAKVVVSDIPLRR
jgi:hypothetical protein